MDLFNQTIDRHTNWLPYEGTVNYYGKLVSQDQANHYLQRLLDDIEWKNDEAVIFGKKIITKRKVAWYGDRKFEYTYSNITKHALSFTNKGQPPGSLGLIFFKSSSSCFIFLTFRASCLSWSNRGGWHVGGQIKIQSKLAQTRPIRV